MSERASGHAGRTHTVLWLCVLALGVWLFFEGLEARSEQLETRRIVEDLDEQKRDLEFRNAKTRQQIRDIRNDSPAAVKDELQKHGHIEEGRVAVDVPPPPPAKGG